MSNHNNKYYFRNFLYIIIILFIILIILTRSLQWQELSVGIFISFILSLSLSKRYENLGLPPLSIKRIIYFIAYLFVLLVEITKANFDVAYRVIHPQMPIKPGVVVIKTSLKQDMAKLILANSITLTPGTFTLDIKGDKLLIHWIYVRSEDVDDSTQMIGARFEKYLKVIFA